MIDWTRSGLAPISCGDAPMGANLKWEISIMQGRKVPDVTFKTRVRDETVEGSNPYRWQDTTTADVFAGKRVVVFSLPGAFTPTCSNEQCPAFERLYEEFKAAGVDEVVCITVN